MKIIILFYYFQFEMYYDVLIIKKYNQIVKTIIINEKKNRIKILCSNC